MGLLDFIGNLNTAQGGKPSFVDRLNVFGANLQDISDGGNRAATIREQQQAALAAEQARQQRQQLAAYAEQVGLSPREKLLFMANPNAFAALLQKQAEPYTLSEGQSRFGVGGEVMAESPKTLTFGDQVLSVGSGGVTPLYTRGKTYSEQNNDAELAERIASRLMSNQFERDRIGIARGQLGVSQGQLGLSRDRLNYDKGQSGGQSGGAPWMRKW